MADEDGWNDGPGPPEEDEDQQQGPRRVKPLFRFRRNKGEVEGLEEPQEPPVVLEEDGPESPQRVRPVRVVKFVPTQDAGAPPDGREGQEPFIVAEDVEEEGTDAPFTIAEEVEEGEFTEVVGEADAPFTIAEEVEEGGFTEVVDEVDTPFTVAEEVEEGGFTEVAGEADVPVAILEEPGAPEVPFAVIEEVDREEIVDEGTGPEEEAELGDDLQFRQEETPGHFQEDDARGKAPDEAKPHYHKYLKPDDELLRRQPSKGHPTGFDRDLESEAGEIDFGIDLIDPSDRKKKRPPKRGPKDAGAQKKGAVGGHDSDGEVGTRELGVDIGVDYTKRRKRRL